jgi:hypothetical protein
MTTHIFRINDMIEHRVDQKASECSCICEPQIVWIHPKTGLPLESPLVCHQTIDDTPVRIDEPAFGTAFVDD